MPSIDDLLLWAKDQARDPQLLGPLNNLPKPVKQAAALVSPATAVVPYGMEAAGGVSKVITGGLFAFIGALRANPMSFTDTPADQAQAEETARRARLDTSDPMIRAFLAWDQQQGNPIGRALAANEGAASTPGGGNVLTGIANATFDPTNLIPMPAGKAGKAIEAGRKSERLAKIMEGTAEAGTEGIVRAFADQGDRLRAIEGTNRQGDLIGGALQDTIAGVKVKPKRVDYSAFPAMIEDASRQASLPGLGTPRTRFPKMLTTSEIQALDESEKLAYLRQLRDSGGAIQSSIEGLKVKPKSLQYDLLGQLPETAEQGMLGGLTPNGAAFPTQAIRGRDPLATALAQKFPGGLDDAAGTQLGLIEDLANSVGDKGTGYDRFVTRLAAITKKEGEVPPVGSSFWTEARGGSFAPEEVQRYFARARHEGILGDNLDAVLPEPNLSNVNLLDNVAPELGDLPDDSGTILRQIVGELAGQAYGERAGNARLGKILKREGLQFLPDGRIGTRAGKIDVTDEVLDYLHHRPDFATDAAAAPLREQLRQRIADKVAGTKIATAPEIGGDIAAGGGGAKFIFPGANAAIGLGKAALTSPVLGPAITGGVAGATTGAIAGGTTGFLANPEDRWGGLVNGARGGAVVGAAIGAGSFAYGLRHVDRTTWENLAKHSWDLSRADVAASAKATKGGSILPSPKELISFWKNQTVSTVRQFGQDGTWNRLVLDGLQGKSATKLLGDTTRQISERMALKGNDRLSTPVQGILSRFGMKDRELELGMPLVEAVAQHGLSRAKSITSSLLLSSFSPSNVAGVAAAGLKGAAMPEFSGVIRHANGALNRGFREAAFVDEIDNKLIPLAVDEFKKLGYDLSSIPVDQLTADAVKQLHGARAGGMWQKALDNMVPLAESRVRYLFGDYSHGQKGAIGLIEKITGPGMPFSSWAIRAYPVALDMAVQNPWVALGVYQFLRATSAQAGKDGRPRWAAGKIPISTETPLLGAGARTLLGGQDGTAYIDPVGSLSPVGGDMFQPGNENEGPQSLYQQVSETIGRVGLPGLSPIAQGIAYMLGLDYKGPGNLSRTQGSENALGLLPGNIDLPGWGDVALRAARGKVSPAFAGTELGAKLGAQGDAHPTVYDPVARRYGELVVEATGHSLDDPGNRAYLYDLAAGTGELYDQARREVLLGGAARNVSSMTSPIGVATQGEGARRAKAEREGIPVKYADIAATKESGTKQQVAALNALNDTYKRAHPWAAAYDVGSKDEGQAMLLQDALDRYTFRGRQFTPSSPAQLQRVVEAGRVRAEGNRTPPKK